jgi:hypothetical protein
MRNAFHDILLTRLAGAARFLTVGGHVGRVLGAFTHRCPERAQLVGVRTIGFFAAVIISGGGSNGLLLARGVMIMCVMMSWHIAGSIGVGGVIVMMRACWLHVCLCACGLDACGLDACGLDACG